MNEESFLPHEVVRLRLIVLNFGLISLFNSLLNGGSKSEIPFGLSHNHVQGTERNCIFSGKKIKKASVVFGILRVTHETIDGLVKIFFYGVDGPLR